MFASSRSSRMPNTRPTIDASTTTPSESCRVAFGSTRALRSRP
jgi:hypothetical protein